MPDLATLAAASLSTEAGLALPAALLPTEPGPYIALMLIGFAVGILGHLTRARWLVASGIVLIFLGAFLFPLAVNLTNDPPPRPAPSRGDVE